MVDLNSFNNFYFQLIRCAAIFEKNYAAYCMCFHEVAAQFDFFPLINLKDLGQVLSTIGIYSNDISNEVSEIVVVKYQKI